MAANSSSAMLFGVCLDGDHLRERKIQELPQIPDLRFPTQDSNSVNEPLDQGIASYINSDEGGMHSKGAVKEIENRSSLPLLFLLPSNQELLPRIRVSC